MQVNSNKDNKPASNLRSKKRLYGPTFDIGVKQSSTTTSPKSKSKSRLSEFRGPKISKEKEKKDNLTKIIENQRKEYQRQIRLERRSESNTESENQDSDWFFKTFLVRAKEILVLLSFIVGITFTALIATGILAWGMLALGIFEAIGFLSASHLFGTFSLTDRYYIDGPDGVDGVDGWGNPLLKYQYKLGDEDEDEDRSETISDILVVFKFIVFPLIFLSGGITLIILGNAGIIGCSLSLILGIPSIIASLSALNFLMKEQENRGDKELRSGWRKFVIVTGILAVATFFVLSFTGVFALPVAVGFALPVIGFDLWTLAVKCIECCIRNSEEAEEKGDFDQPMTGKNSLLKVKTSGNKNSQSLIFKKTVKTQDQDLQ